MSHRRTAISDQEIAEYERVKRERERELKRVGSAIDRKASELADYLEDIAGSEILFIKAYPGDVDYEHLEDAARGLKEELEIMVREADKLVSLYEDFSMHQEVLLDAEDALSEVEHYREKHEEYLSERVI